MRTTSDPKLNNLKVRLNNDMLAFLENKSSKNKETISDHIRWLIEKEMEEDRKSK